MIQPVILEKLAELPESLETEVLHYIEFLIEKQAKNSTQEKPTQKRRVAEVYQARCSLSNNPFYRGTSDL